MNGQINGFGWIVGWLNQMINRWRDWTIHQWPYDSMDDLTKTKDGWMNERKEWMIESRDGQTDFMHGLNFVYNFHSMIVAIYK